ncbi:hemerythrin domain-containing protein [Amycolatopsis nigrescens]|uniref:hemerythrin domain-containing protein n=1 Tax=Amycolatopsis nigrescens TaxID=381445 RepID=UPI0003799402|nr:hemerythrin domain-containing protein [Amycolatopsis nigrescens]
MAFSDLPRTAAARHDSGGRLIAMSASHEAFRRDLASMAKAATPVNLCDPVRNASIMTGWELFKYQLHNHHRHEDLFLWPRLRLRLGKSESAVSTLDDMETEHGLIDPLLAAVDEAFATPGTADVAAVVDELNSKLSFHLEHEEQDAMPMIGEAITDREWRRIALYIRLESRISSAAQFLPWLTEGTTEAETRKILSILPWPATAIYRRVWKPRYDWVSRW